MDLLLYCILTVTLVEKRGVNEHSYMHSSVERTVS